MWKKYAAVALTLLALASIPGAAAAQSPEPPAVPTGTSVEMTLGQILVTWDSPSDPGVTAHRVYRQTDGAAETLAGETDHAQATSLTDPAGEPGQTLTYRVTAVGAAGESERSEPVSITLRPKPVAITASAFHPTTGEEANPGYRAFIRRPVDYVTPWNGRGRGWITQITAPAITWHGNVENLFRRSTHPAMVRIYRTLIAIILHTAATTIAPAE